MLTAIIYIVILFAAVIALMLILVEVIEKKDKYKYDVERLNRLNNDISKENIDLKKLLETQDKLLEAGI